MHSVTKHIYDIGWRGVNIEPVSRKQNNGLEEGNARYQEVISTADWHYIKPLRYTGKYLNELGRIDNRAKKDSRSFSK